MKLTKLSLVVALTAMTSGSAFAENLLSNVFSPRSNVDKVQVEDPYAEDSSNSPWEMMMNEVTLPDGRVLDGRASGFGSVGGSTFDSFAPFTGRQSNLISGYGSSTVGFGCDGINLGSVIDGQLAQYGSMVEQFIQNAPAMAIMYLAYSQPTVKAVIDELNMVSQFGLDMSNMTCSGVRAMADKSLEDKKQTMAEAQCTAEAGFKDPECMSGEGISDSLISIMRETKTAVNDRAGSLMSGVTSATGGIVKFNGGVGGTGQAGTPGSPGTPGGAAESISGRSCGSVEIKGLLGLILSASELTCEDIKNYAGLLPNYETEEDVQGVIPRQMTLQDVSKKLTAQYYEWVMNILATDEDTFVESEGFKAIANRIGMVITDHEHRALVKLSKTQPTEFIAVVRNIATIATFKDLGGIVNRLEVGVLTGIQNQPNSEYITPRQIDQYNLAIKTLRSELNAMTEQVNFDRAGLSVLNGAK